MRLMSKLGHANAVNSSRRLSRKNSNASACLRASHRWLVLWPTSISLAGNLLRPPRSGSAHFAEETSTLTSQSLITKHLEPIFARHDRLDRPVEELSCDGGGAKVTGGKWRRAGGLRGMRGGVSGWRSSLLAPYVGTVDG